MHLGTVTGIGRSVGGESLPLPSRFGDQALFRACSRTCRRKSAVRPWDRRCGGEWAAVLASQSRGRGLDKEPSELVPGAIIGLESAGPVARDKGTFRVQVGLGAAPE